MHESNSPNQTNTFRRTIDTNFTSMSKCRSTTTTEKLSSSPLNDGSRTPCLETSDQNPASSENDLAKNLLDGLNQSFDTSTVMNDFSRSESPKTTKMVPSLPPDAYTGYEVEGRWRGLHTLFLPGYPIVDQQALTAFLAKTHVSHVYFGVKQSNVRWQQEGALLWNIIGALPHMCFTIEEQLLNREVPQIPAVFFNHPRIRVMFTLDGFQHLVPLLTQDVEIKIDGQYASVILQMAQKFSTTYLKDTPV